MASTVTLRESDLPMAGALGRCPAGEGKRCRPGREPFSAWVLQLADWGLRMNARPHERRLWRVLANAYSGEKTEVTLPSGRQLKAYSAGKLRLWSHPTQPNPGPEFYLTFRDARALWRDTHLDLVPACDRIEVAGTPAPEEEVSA